MDVRDSLTELLAPPLEPSPPLDDLILMPEVLARRALAGQPLRFSLLAPLGQCAGRGSLRVLRALPQGDALELVCGYEAYVPLFARAGGARA